MPEYTEIIPDLPEYIEIIPDMPEYTEIIPWDQYHHIESRTEVVIVITQLILDKTFFYEHPIDVMYRMFGTGNKALTIKGINWTIIVTTLLYTSA